MIRVLLVEDHAAFREALTFLLGREPDLEVVAQAGSLAEARGALGGGLDVAVVDLNLPDGDGGELIGELLRASPGAKVLVLSATVGPKTSTTSAWRGPTRCSPRWSPPHHRRGGKAPGRRVIPPERDDASANFREPYARAWSIEAEPVERPASVSAQATIIRLKSTASSTA